MNIDKDNRINTITIEFREGYSITSHDSILSPEEFNKVLDVLNESEFFNVLFNYMNKHDEED